MTLCGPHLHVFILRARLEPREIPGAKPEWRFWVEHHAGGEQRHFKDFAGVLEFIAGYIPDLKANHQAGRRSDRPAQLGDP